MGISESLIVGFDSQGGDRTVLIVGRQRPGGQAPVEIINAYEGEEAKKIYDLLTIKPKEGETWIDRISATK